MAKIEKAPDFVSKEVARLTKMKVSKSAVSQQVVVSVAGVAVFVVDG